MISEIRLEPIPSVDVALIKLRNPTSRLDLIGRYGVLDPAAEDQKFTPIATVQGWGDMVRDGRTPAPRLQTSQNEITAIEDRLIRMHELNSHLESGDSGAGVFVSSPLSLGATCGVFSNSTRSGIATATTTQSLAAWILATTHILPGGICRVPKLPKQRLQLMVMSDRLANGVKTNLGGFRKFMSSALTSDGLTADFVGRSTLGNPPASQFEGQAYWTISQFLDDAQCALFDKRPDVVMLEIGENDVLTADPSVAANGVNQLISKIVNAAPQTSVLVAPLPPNRDPALEARVELFNSAVQAEVNARANVGQHVAYVDLDGITTDDLLPTNRLYSELTDEGYMKMANAFTVATERAIDSGWISSSTSFTGQSCRSGGGGIGGRGLPPLRLMPLGDSITWGFKSSTGNGYRGPLRDALLNDGLAVDFVGTLSSGSMADPFNEGHPGFRIDQIDALTSAAVSEFEPNLITVMAGTNDMNQSWNLSSAPDRLSSLVDKVLAASPGATVLVSNLIPSRDSGVYANIQQFNAQVPAVVEAKQSAGQHVALVDMSAVQIGDMTDTLHPNDRGYGKIADAWHNAIRQVETSGWLSPPVSCASIPAGCNNPAIEAGSDASGSGGGSFSLPFSKHSPTSIGPHRTRQLKPALEPLLRVSVPKVPMSASPISTETASSTMSSSIPSWAL